MSVARETILLALREMLELEEFAVQNIGEVNRFDFAVFSPSDRKKIIQLLSILQEDSQEHEDFIIFVMERLTHGAEKDHSLPKGDPLGIPGHPRP